VDGKRLQHELGFVPQYDLSAGWRETVREMQAVGDLLTTKTYKLHEK